MEPDTDFLDRILQGFASLRDRPAFKVIQGQFEAGELTFIVDRQGIRIHLDEIQLDEPEVSGEDLDE
jgi:multidrug resistance efflux pump